MIEVGNTTQRITLGQRIHKLLFVCILSTGTPCGMVWDKIAVAFAPWQVLALPTASVPEYCGTTLWCCATLSVGNSIILV